MAASAAAAGNHVPEATNQLLVPEVPDYLPGTLLSEQRGCAFDDEGEHEPPAVQHWYLPAALHQV
jgi:hypothetical protein